MEPVKWWINNVMSWFFPYLLGISLMLSGCAERFQFPALFNVGLEPVETSVVVPELPPEADSSSPFPILNSSLPAAVAKTIELSSVAVPTAPLTVTPLVLEQGTTVASPELATPEPTTPELATPELATPEPTTPKLTTSELTAEMIPVESDTIGEPDAIVKPDTPSIAIPIALQPAAEAVSPEPDVTASAIDPAGKPSANVAPVELENSAVAEEVYPQFAPFNMPE
jgi:hypothetical protein